MYNNERVILFDENGSPYIAHASLFGKSSGKKDTKFIDKIKDNKGKTRYFYTQDEIKAYYDNLKGKASNAVQNARQGIQNVSNQVRQGVQNAGNAVKQAARQVGDEIATSSGAARRQQWQDQQRTALAATRKAQQSANEAAQARNRGNTYNYEEGRVYGSGKSYHNEYDVPQWYDNAKDRDKAYDATQKAVWDSHQAAYERQLVQTLYRMYSGTPLGKLESTLSNAKSAYNKAQGTLKQAASDTMNKVREATGLAARDRRDAARTNYVKKAAEAEAAAKAYGNSSEYKKIDDANTRRANAYVQEIKAHDDELKKRTQARGAKAEFDLNRALNNASDSIDMWNEAERESSRAKQEYNNAQKAYKNTPAGRVENAVNVTKAEYNKLQNKLREAGELSQAEMQKLFSYIQDNYSKK